MVNAILAVVLSFIIPGLGQSIAGDIKKGVIFLIVAIIIGAIASLIFRHWIVWIIDWLTRYMLLMTHTKWRNKIIFYF